MNYIDLFHSGELLHRLRVGYARLRSCDLCPHECGVDRLAGERGFCRSGSRLKIASANVHRGEEPPISGTRGSGTIFFTGCTLRCRFCQNFPISQLGNGEEVTPLELAERMLRLERRGVHNINFVTPTQYLPQILAALFVAVSKGFRLPLVWNSSGYEKVNALRLLEGIVDIYLPDMKYADDEAAAAFSSAGVYRDINRKCVLEMYRQVGHLRTDADGIAEKGLIIRHLVLPEGNAGTTETLQWIAENLGVETHIALMSQFFPAHEARSVQGIHRTLLHQEYDAAVAALEELGLENGWLQDLDEERKPL